MKQLLITVIKKLHLNPDDHGIWKFFGKPVLIGFYEHEFYVLSNFSSFQVELDGKIYPTSEHAYHVFKFADEALREKIRNAPSAHEAFGIAQEHIAQRRSDWDQVRISIMKRILIAKVDQHPYVKKKLLASGTVDLVENSWRDAAWGWGAERNGKNLLGKLWMEIRDEIMSRE